MIQGLRDNLKTMRIKNNLSRKDVSELAGVSVSMIGLYESGERTPSLQVLIKLAANYKVSVDYLLGNDTSDRNTLSLEGLTDKQIQALKLTADCFRSHNKLFD